MPGLIGMELDEAVKLAINEGLNVRIIGSGQVFAQSLPLGAKVKRGEVIVLESIAQDFND